MRGSLLCLLSCLLLSASAVSTVQAADLGLQRQYYDEAKRALAKGDTGPYFRNRQVLRDYPLEPYLAYDELTARLKTASNAEIEQFLAEHGDLPQANWMKLRWLRWLADRGDWQPFLKYYDPKLNFTELDCLNAQYQISHNQLAEGYANTEKLWLVGKSQPEACDVLFDTISGLARVPEVMIIAVPASVAILPASSFVRMPPRDSVEAAAPAIASISGVIRSTTGMNAAIGSRAGGAV